MKAVGFQNLEIHWKDLQMSAIHTCPEVLGNFSGDQAKRLIERLGWCLQLDSFSISKMHQKW